MRAFLLAAGYGKRFRPVTETIPKPLVPFLNVPLLRQHLALLKRHGILEAGVNLHHLGEKIERELRDRPADLPDVRFFPEPEILGTAGALRNAAGWLSGGDFLLLNTDTFIQPDFGGLLDVHRKAGNEATLLVVENRNPDWYTPLQAEGDRITAFGGSGPDPLLYTGVAVLSPGLLARIPGGETGLVADLCEPLLRENPRAIGLLRHEGPFAELGRPSDFLSASLEALDRGGPFPDGAGTFDAERRVLSLAAAGKLEAWRSVIGAASIAGGARVRDSVVWSGVGIGSDADLRNCVAAGGRIPAGARHEGVLLWPGKDGVAAAYPLS
ncbi:MAG TPA: NDP-sugar synthase [Thermoanaerobaculia bacterium]|nr:NDP-sugar synthase [Thermoanaerobaculia bacterium]